ncbi:protein vein [Belonocnema kinseyi]|uniref:protein vein n=1 Tax=Belonocnema kinseyi TaxID=2817044 RepID=UPI00143D1BB6|nr:protein vein [Belonocnema kinseyi]
MWASLLLAGILSSWWGALAFAAAPPAELASFLPPNNNLVSPKDSTENHQVDAKLFRRSETGSWSYSREAPFWENFRNRVTPMSHHHHDFDRDYFFANQNPFRNNDKSSSNPFDRTNFHLYSSRNLRMDLVMEHPLRMEQRQFLQPPHHSTQSPLTVKPDSYFTSSSPTIEMPRVSRSVKQRKNRTKADSPREQRRRCRMRNNCRGRNWCPDLDIGNRAFLAPTVFEGKARSMSSLRKPGSNYAVTFEVRQVYKNQGGFMPLQKNDSVRLHFRDKVAPGKSTICGYEGNDATHQQQQRDIQSGVVRANIKRGKVYLVFVNRVGPRNFTILGEPVIRSKKNEQAVQAVVRPDYVREVTLSELRDSVARLQDRVKLVCRTRGSPPPKVQWFKDGVSLHPHRGLRIQNKRRRSKVVIASAKLEDSGRYECVAESTSGHRASLAAQLLVTQDTRNLETTTVSWPRQEQPCPIAGDFCMNGGTCLFFETVGEPACRCADGFTGLRCETKDVISTGNTDKFSSFTEDLTLARF